MSDDFDPWTQHIAVLAKPSEHGLAAENDAQAQQPEYLTIAAHEIPPLPDQDETPFWDREWIAPKLKDLLFDQSNEGAFLRTYFIADATLRKNVVGAFDLDALDVPVQCLFKGEAAEDLKEAAPYLIDMTLPDGAWDDSAIVPAFHKDFFANHWGQNTGIFVRTTAPMSDVWGHFRKFTLVAREGHSSRVFVPFWSEQYARLYFPHIANNPDRVAQWFLRDGFEVHSIVADQNNGSIAKEIALKPELFTRHNRHAQQFAITEYDLIPFYEDRKKKDTQQLVEALKAGFPQELKNYSAEAIFQILADPLQRMRGYGFKQKGSLYVLASWGLFFGQNFETKDPTGKLLEICKSSLSERDKLAALKARMAEFPAPQKATS